ncbi:MAG TPA: hypothetical protein VMV09_00260 [Candidatus Saccharimonadales bacterium]|nr:hypothetical protein [Candidatus Saccharimonadales bacterium]
MPYEINQIADAVLAVAERRESNGNDLGIVCGAYEVEADDLLEVLDHLHFETTPPGDAFASGVLIGLALARGDVPSPDSPRPDWWSDLFSR